MVEDEAIVGMALCSILQLDRSSDLRPRGVAVPRARACQVGPAGCALVDLNWNENATASSLPPFYGIGTALHA